MKAVQAKAHWVHGRRKRPAKLTKHTPQWMGTYKTQVFEMDLKSKDSAVQVRIRINSEMKPEVVLCRPLSSHTTFDYKALCHCAYGTDQLFGLMLEYVVFGVLRPGTAFYML